MTNKLFGGKRSKKKDVIELETAPEQEEVEEEAQEEYEPTAEDFLNPDLDNGMGRLILLLSDGGNRIHTMRARLSFAQQTVMLLDQASQSAKEMIVYAIAMEEQNQKLRAEVDFLRDQISKGASPPPKPHVPAPFDEVKVRQLTEVAD